MKVEYDFLVAKVYDGWTDQTRVNAVMNVCTLNFIPFSEFYKDKRIIITGTSRGIGKDLAIQLAQTGAR